MSPIIIRPMLTGVKPSTSFSGEIASMTRLVSIPFGSGSCTSTPSISGSALRRAISATSLSSATLSGSRTSTERIPASAQARSLAVT